MKYTEIIGDIKNIYEAETPEKVSDLYNKINQKDIATESIKKE